MRPVTHAWDGPYDSSVGPVTHRVNTQVRGLRGHQVTVWHQEKQNRHLSWDNLQPVRGDTQTSKYILSLRG